eukprot:1152030-Pelagomonas_calceolata.AAC.14
MDARFVRDKVLPVTRSHARAAAACLRQGLNRYQHATNPFVPMPFTSPGHCFTLPQYEAVAAAFLTPTSHTSSADYVWAVAVAHASAGSMTSHREQQPGRNAPRGEDDAGASGLCGDRNAWR